MNCRCDFSVRCLISAMNYMLLALSVILFAALAVVFFQTLFCWEYHPQITREGVSAMQEFWVEYKYIIQAFAGCLTLFIVSYNLQKYIDIETVKALGDLRNKLNSEEKKKLHVFLMHESEKGPILKGVDKDLKENDKTSPDNVTLFDYIGTLELGAIMVRRGVITVDEFYNQFGYRVENLMNNAEIKSHIKDNLIYYKALRYIVQRLIKADKLPADCGF